VDGQPFVISASIGVALYPNHGLDPITLVRHAELAMYEAKRRNDTTVIYTPQMDGTSAPRLSLLADLRRALEDLAHRDEITIFYQPQVAINSGEVVGAEALLRWHHPDSGPVNVEDILQVAEHSPVMRQLTLRVVDDVASQLAQWNSTGLSLRASVNVSARDLDAPELVNHIVAALEWRQVRPTQLTLEVTETALMEQLGPVQATLQRLADLGITVALDDFGTGYSSLAHVRRLPVTEIKIDRSFTSRMAKDPGDNAIVRSTIHLARDLGLRVVAEGVEDTETYDMLAEAGCDIAQGWLIARPMPAAQFVRWLHEYRGVPAPGIQTTEGSSNER
jgi:EAL domain-containing protein (putative c-di-GMP-specific phosphodiesterase class I)